MSKKNLTNNAIRILADLCRAKRPLPVKRIAERTNVSWKTANDNIKILEKRKLVKCKKSKRRNYCEPTKEVKNICGRTRK